MNRIGTIIPRILVTLSNLSLYTLRFARPGEKKAKFGLDKKVGIV